MMFATDIQAAYLRWCRTKNAGIRFESDGTVSVWANGKKRRRPTFFEAVHALCDAFDCPAPGQCEYRVPVNHGVNEHVPPEAARTACTDARPAKGESRWCRLVAQHPGGHA